MIGHTQPRRIAARSVAERLAERARDDAGRRGRLPGALHRPDRRADTRIKVMTDGILLAELQRDRQLRRYDTIIIDEAHERSLNIDFLLGYLKRLLPRRPDLKLVITSATIDPSASPGTSPTDAGRPARSSRSPAGPTRSRSATARWSTLPETDEEGEAVVRDQTEAILDAVRELSGEGPGDILVFLPGEREIRDTADALSDLKPDRGRHSRSCPLYSRLSAAEQHRVFSSHPATVRRVVLATNVAETSLTVPGIRYVVDTGVARISRVLDEDQGAAAADRGDQPGVGPAAVRPLRARRGRASRSGCTPRRTSRRAGVHRPRDPAHQPGLGDPADDLARARRRRPLPVRRAARPSQRRGRRPAARGARRPGLDRLDRASRDQRRGRRRPRRAAAGAAARSTRGWAG